jgi:hypothetical protein
MDRFQTSITMLNKFKLIESSYNFYAVSRACFSQHKQLYGTESLALFLDCLLIDDIQNYVDYNMKTRLEECKIDESNRYEK